ncbi:MAG: SPOR domain-containing protein [Gammaproteobacteria bacterium]|nr:SPOR domain-containing protein [Gammaproteobacteria bacterium]
MSFSDALSKQLKPDLALESQQSMLSKIEGYAIYSDRLTCLIGSLGSGKTSILKQVQSVLPPEVELIYKDCSSESWYKELLSQLGISGSAARHSFQFGIGQIESKKDLLLLLDNAESLSLEQIERLADKVKEENFHCLMAIDESSPLSDWFLDEHQRVVPLNVERLSDEESVHLLADTLNLEEGQLLALYDEKTLDNIIVQSKGLPGNIISHAARLDSKVPSTHNIDIKKLIKVASIGLAALILALTLVFQEKINNLISADPMTVDSVKEHENNQDLRAEKGSANIAEGKSKEDEVFLEVVPNQIDSESDTSALTTALENEVTEQEGSSKSKITDEVPTSDAVTQETSTSDANTSEANTSEANVAHEVGESENLDATVQKSKEKLKPETSEKGSSEIASLESETSKEALGTDGSVISPAKEKENNVELSELEQPKKDDSKLNQETISLKEENIVSKSTSETQVNEVADVQSEVSRTNADIENNKQENLLEENDTAKDKASNVPKNEKPIKPLSVKTEVRFNSQEQYLLTLPNTDYFIQLAGFSALENVSSFLEKHKSQGALHFYRSIRDDSIWYVVVLGPFKDSASANLALENLSSDLKKGGPWIKSSGSIQSAIQQLP